jgi:hypothetical protein
MQPLLIAKRENEVLNVSNPEQSVRTGYNNSEAHTLKNSEMPMNQVHVEGNDNFRERNYNGIGREKIK